MEIQVRKPIELTIRGVLVKGDVVFRKYRVYDTSFGYCWSGVNSYPDVKRPDGKPITKLQMQAVYELAKTYTATENEFKTEFDRLKTRATEYMKEAMTKLRDMIEAVERGERIRVSQCYFQFESYREVLELGTYESMVRV